MASSDSSFYRFVNELVEDVAAEDRVEGGMMSVRSKEDEIPREENQEADQMIVEDKVDSMPYFLYDAHGILDLDVFWSSGHGNDYSDYFPLSSLQLSPNGGDRMQLYLPNESLSSDPNAAAVQGGEEIVHGPRQRVCVLRGTITLEEQLLILKLHSCWGNRWSKIAQHLPGRTSNEIKNYWRTRVQKQAKQLKCGVNSKQFKDAMRCLWMPRLVERIQAATAAAATEPTTASTTINYTTTIYHLDSLDDSKTDNNIGSGQALMLQADRDSLTSPTGYFSEELQGPDFRATDQNNHRLTEVTALDDEERTFKTFSREDITLEVLQRHFGKKLDEAAKILGVSRSTLKRICRERKIGRWPSYTRDKIKCAPCIRDANKQMAQDCHRDTPNQGINTNVHPLPQVTPMQDESLMTTIKAKCGEDLIMFKLSDSSRMMELEDEVEKRLKLQAFKAKFFDQEDELILLACDEELSHCLRTMKSLGRTTVRMVIEPII